MACPIPIVSCWPATGVSGCPTRKFPHWTSSGNRKLKLHPSGDGPLSSPSNGHASLHSHGHQHIQCSTYTLPIFTLLRSFDCSTKHMLINLSYMLIHTTIFVGEFYRESDISQKPSCWWRWGIPVSLLFCGWAVHFCWVISIPWSSILRRVSQEPWQQSDMHRWHRQLVAPPLQLQIGAMHQGSNIFQPTKFVSNQQKPTSKQAWIRSWVPKMMTLKI